MGARVGGALTQGAAWTPFHAHDLAHPGLLPEGWQAAVRALAEAPERQVLHDDHDLGLFACVDGAAIRARLPWLWRLYHGELRTFAAASVGYPLVAARRLRAATTLNILAGRGAANDWHTDMNAVTGVFYAVVPTGGGDLGFRDAEGREALFRPRPGLFVCFEGGTEHRVTPLAEKGLRLAVPMVYYRAGSEQPPAYGDDVYAPVE